MSYFLQLDQLYGTLEGHSNTEDEEKRADGQELCSRKLEGSDPGQLHGVILFSLKTVVHILFAVNAFFP